MELKDIADSGFGTVIGEMYITLLPVIIAGILNMVWCKLPWPDSFRTPIDSGKNWRDGKRLLGNNKTWIGFVGMLLLGTASMLLWGMVCGASPYFSEHNYFYRNYVNTPAYNAIAGFLTGFAYVLFELPNSFLKRRLGIEPGRRLNGRFSALFVILDQADSVFGIVIAVALVFPMSLTFFLIYVFVGTATHIVTNMLLYAVRLRKNPF